MALGDARFGSGQFESMVPSDPTIDTLWFMSSAVRSCSYVLVRFLNNLRRPCGGLLRAGSGRRVSNLLAIHGRFVALRGEF
jgi:hypothetical protein